MMAQGFWVSTQSSVSAFSGTTWNLSTDATYGRKIQITPGVTYDWRWTIPRGTLTIGDRVWAILRVSLPTFNTNRIDIAWYENSTVTFNVGSYTSTSPLLGTVVELALPLTIRTSSGNIQIRVTSPLGLPSGISGTFEILGMEIWNGDDVSPVINSTYPPNIQTVGTAAPTTGTWAQSDIVWNTAAASGGPPGWMCTAAGTPGTWKAMANFA